MGSSWSNMFVKKIDRNILLLGREGVGKTHLLYRLKGLSPKTGEAIELLPTNAFNHFQIDFHAFERQIEVWDPSGKPSHVSLWNTYYETVFFHVVIYVIDANCYDTLDAKRKAAAVREDKMEIHTLLCADALRDTHMVIYLNWKTDAQGRQAVKALKDNVRATLPDDLEFHTSAFVDRSIIVVDNMDDLQPHMLDLGGHSKGGGGSGGGGGGSGGASAEVSKSGVAQSRKSRAMPESSATR